MTKQRQTIDAWMQLIIFALFNILLFTTPFIFTWFNQELFEFNKMIVVYFLTTLIVALWAWRSVIRGQLLWKNRPHNYVLALFILSQLISTILSIHQRTSIYGYYTRFNGGLLSVFTYALLFFAAQYNLNKKQLKILLINLLLASLLITLYAIPEHFGYSASCLIVTGNFNVTCWVQDVQNRVFATFGQPNWLAAFLIMTMPLAIYQLWENIQEKKPNSLKIIYYSLLVFLITTALFFTKSRSGILALTIALIIQFLGQRFLVNKKNQQTPHLKQLLLAILPILLALILFGHNLNLNKSNQSLLSSFTEGLENNNGLSEVSTPTVIQEGGSKSSDIRKVVWQGAWQVWQRYPIFGSGVETFAYSYYRDRPAEHNLLSEWDFLYNKAHNELLNFLANSGVLGLISYLTLFAALLIYLIKQWQTQRLTSLQIALTSALVAMFISNFFGFSTVTSNLLFAIFAAVIVKEEIAWPKIKKTDLGWSEYLLSAAIVLISFVLGKSIWQIWRADYLFYNGKNHLREGNWQTGLSLMQEAIEQSPQEALFYDELAIQYSLLAIAFAQEDQATSSAKFAEAAITTSNFAQKLNPAHLNFYKDRARIFIRLAQLDKGFYQLAKDTLLQGIELSPTEAKLYYNLALLEQELGNHDRASEILKQAIALKTNYWEAYFALGQILDIQGNTEEAASYYQLILEKIDPDNNLAKEALEKQQE